MAGLNKIGTITAGVYTNPNTFTRSLSLAYENLGTELNKVVDILNSLQRGPVPDDIDTRWSYAVSPVNHGTTINPASSGLDGTAMFIYAGSNYGTIDPLFLVYDPNNTANKRPATIYESFTKLKLYTDNAIAQRAAAIISMVTGSEINLVGAPEGAVLQNISGNVAASSWRFSTDGADHILNAPGGNYFVSNSNQIKLQAPEVKLITNFLTLTDVEDIPSGAEAGVGRIYYSTSDSALHLVDHTGNDTALGSGGGGSGWTHTQAILDDTDSPYNATITSNSNTYLIETAGGEFTLNLPALSGVTNGSQVIISNYTGTAETNNITVVPNGTDSFLGVEIASGESLVLDTNWATVGLQKTSVGWLILYIK